MTQSNLMFTHTKGAVFTFLLDKNLNVPVTIEQASLIKKIIVQK